MNRQGMRGFAGQGMDAQRAEPDQDEPHIFPAAASAYSWTVPRTGKWKFVGWGAGGGGSPAGGGASGGYFEITRQLRRGAVVTITAGVASSSDTSVVLPSATATATRANGQTAGTATGGDVNLAGSAGVAAGSNPGAAGLGTGGGAGGAATSGSGGSGAPANLPYRGGAGGPGSGQGGVGAGAGEQGVATIPGQSGLVLAVLIKGS
jgi:hypothetical protein